MKKHQRAGAGYEEIELALRTDGVDHRVTFMGRRLVRVSQPAPEGTRIDTVYQTAKNQLAVATKIQRKLPDWAAGQENLWSHPETWDRDFWVAGDKTMVVYPDIEHLGQVDGALAERVESALAIPPFEVLDIRHAIGHPRARSTKTCTVDRTAHNEPKHPGFHTKTHVMGRP